MRGQGEKFNCASSKLFFKVWTLYHTTGVGRERTGEEKMRGGFQRGVEEEDREETR